MSNYSITFEIKSDQKQNAISQTTANVNKMPSTQNNEDIDLSELSLKSLGDKIGGAMILTKAVKTAKSICVSNFNYNVSIVEVRTGSSELQEKANSILELATHWYKHFNIESLVNYGQNVDKERIMRAIERETISRNLTRAGTNGSR